MNHRHIRILSLAPLAGLFFVGACGAASRNPTASSNDGGSGTTPGDFAPDTSASCTGLECQKANCPSDSPTAIEGAVFDPSGKATLYNVRVFVPNEDPAPFEEGVTSCDRCSAPLTGKPVAATLTDERGRFRLEGVPTGERVPVVIQIGKWRRKVVLPKVDACKTTNVTDGVLAMPRTRSEGDIPRIAVVTGGTAKSATDLWSDVDTLKQYDAVLLACEGEEAETEKPAGAKEALFDYVEAGGRVFATHYHYTWIKGSPEKSFRDVATWNDPASAYGSEVDSVDTSFPKGEALAKWLVENGSSKTSGSIAVDNPARNVASVADGIAQRWIYEPQTNQVRYFSFNAPVGAPPEQQCGRVAFTDIHSRERLGAFTLPGGCDASDMTPQERALEFLLFDLGACIQPDDEKPKTPPIK